MSLRRSHSTMIFRSFVPQAKLPSLKIGRPARSSAASVSRSSPLNGLVSTWASRAKVWARLAGSTVSE